MCPHGEPDDAEVFDFLDEYTRDVEAQRAHPLAHYLRRYPGHEEAIAREFLARQKREPTNSAAPSVDAHGGERRIGPYRLLRELGRGGQGAVWLVEDTRIARKVALKFLPQSFALMSVDARRRLQREAEVVSRLEHPSICPVYEALIDGETPYIAMRFVEGETLASAIAGVKKNRPTTSHESATLVLGSRNGADIRRVLVFFERAARALHAAHEAGVIHRDIKPGNLMVSRDGEPVVLDFGQARDEHAALSEMTISGEVVGTPAYMSPEQVTGSARAVDRRTDVWSLGASLYEALTLERPFAGRTVTDLMLAIQTRPLRSARELNPAIGDELAVVLETALEKDVHRRYASALELAEDLRRIREYEPIRARPASAGLRLRRWAQRHPAMIVLIALLSIGLASSLYQLRREARALDFALGRHLAQRALDLLDDDASASLVLGVKAVQLADHYETRAALASTLADCRMSGMLDCNPDQVRFLDMQATPDSKQIVAGLDDGTVRIFAMRGGRERTRFKAGPGEVRQVRVDPSGEHVFASSTDGVVRVFDTAGAKLRDLALLDHDVVAIELDDSGERLAALDSSGLVRIFATADGHVSIDLRGDRGLFNAIRFSRGGERLLTFSRAARPGAPTSKTAVLWDVKTGERLGELAGHTNTITACEFGASGSIAVTSSLDGTARLWSIPSCTPLGEPLEHGVPVTCASLSPDERQLATGTDAAEQSCASLWNLESRTRVELHGDHLKRIVGVEFSRDGGRLASVSLEMTLHTWSARDGRELSHQKGVIQPIAMAWSPDGQRIVTLNNTNTTYIWYGENPPDAYALIGHDAPLTSVCFSPDGKLALTAGEDGTARLWHTPRNAGERGDLAPGIQMSSMGGSANHVDRASFSPDGSLVLTLSCGGDAQLWNVADGSARGAAMHHPSALRSGEFSSDGRRIVTVADDLIARLFDVDGGDRCRGVELQEHATCAHFTPDSRLVLVGRDDDTLCVIDAQSHAVLHEHAPLEPSNAPGVVDFAVRPDGGQVAVALRSIRVEYVSLIDGTVSKSRSTFAMRDIAYNSTSTCLLMTGRDGGGAMRLLELARKDSKGEPHQVRLQVFHSLPITCSSFSPDGLLVLSGSKDKTAIVRDAFDGEPVARLAKHTGAVTCAAFSRDSGPLRVITGSADGTARVWPVDPLPPALARKPRELIDWELAREQRLALPLEFH